MSILGTVSNSLASISVVGNPTRKNSFCILCLSHTTASLGISLAFFCVASVTLRQAELPTPLMDKIMGQFILVFWNATVLSYLAISLNRLIAIALPFKAPQLLTRKRTIYVVVLIWCIGFCQAVPLFWRSSCYLHYDRRKWKWMFSDGICGKTLFYFEKNKILILILTLILDVLALTKYIKHNKVTSGNTSIFMVNDVQKKRRIEVKFFKQALCQNGLFLVAFVDYHFISPLLTNQWLVLMNSTFVWLLLHVLDGGEGYQIAVVNQNDMHIIGC